MKREDTVEMKRYEVREEREIPEICPLLNTCEQLRTDKEEYTRLVDKWSAYAQEQEPEELTVTGRKGKEEKVTLEEAQPVTGTQVFHLEYPITKDMTEDQKKAVREKKKQRFQQMCPHFKKNVLGMPTSDPPYHDCLKFSEYYYQPQKK